MSGLIARRRVTQADVARLAGVSQAMVSYVLNESKSVSVPDETRRRILDAMEELGYAPNRAARSLRTSRTFTIGCIIPDIANPFYPAFVRGIQDVVDHNNYDLVLYNTDGLATRERKAIRSLLHGRVDGVIGVFFHSNAHDLTALLEHEVAVVRLEATAKRTGELPLDNIYVDNISAARHAVSYLVQRGYMRIAMLTNEPGPGQPRVVGYRMALAEAGRNAPDAYVQIGAFTVEGGAESMQRLLKLTPRPDAVFAANDLMAIGAMMACKAHGLRVPQDIAVMGFDDIPTDQIVSPSLTTVSQFQQNLGRKSAELLFERIEGKTPPTGRNIEMPFEIVVRESA
ncbi:MAG: LacI family DNA-binding transcriptional regulator [Caldilinea sp.]